MRGLARLRRTPRCQHHCGETNHSPKKLKSLHTPAESCTRAFHSNEFSDLKHLGFLESHSHSHSLCSPHMQNPAFLRATPDGLLLSIKLQPRASANQIGEPIGNELRIKVTAPPVDSAANEALLRLLA